MDRIDEVDGKGERMFWRKRKAKSVKVPEMNGKKLLECFAVDPETPLLVGVLCVLAGMEELDKESVAVCNLEDSARAFYAGGISRMMDAQERILELVKRANEGKTG